jgi:hypothetical protein
MLRVSVTKMLGFFYQNNMCVIEGVTPDPQTVWKKLKSFSSKAGCTCNYCSLQIYIWNVPWIELKWKKLLCKNPRNM